MNMKAMGSIVIFCPVVLRLRSTKGILMAKSSCKSWKVNVAASHKAFTMKKAKFTCV